MGSVRLGDATAPAQPKGRSAGPLLSVGITTADWLHMGAELDRLEQAGVDFIHVDVMDGCFCPQLTIGPPVIGALRTRLPKDVHLMIEEPLSKVAAYVEAGAEVVTFHVEATRHSRRVLQVLGSMNAPGDATKKITRGVALNPSTPAGVVEPLLDEADLVLVLAVNPGWGGQRFAPGTERRLAAVRELIERSGCDVKLGVDGGVTRDNIGAIAAMGVDLIVAGSAVFDGGDIGTNVRQIYDAIRPVS
ncbi:MAG: ribulose-phosphate 3-epimerase [Candidatus Dormibacteraceae bacterium]